jgi:HK97 family phage major capsid protein
MKTREELLSEREEHRSRLQEIDAAYAGQFIDPEGDDGREFADRQAQISELDKTIQQLEQRQQLIESLAADERNTEPGTPEFRSAGFNTRRSGTVTGEDIYDLSTVRSSFTNPEMQGRELRDRAKRSIDASRVFTDDEARGKENAQRLVEETDSEDGRFARYLLATGSPTYKRAFGKYMASGDTTRMTREEATAWNAAQAAERAMSLTAANGGYAVPYQLDPTILNTSNGVINPIRQISRVEQITVDEWRGVTSAGITAGYGAEATEATDNAPTLAQPTVSTEKAYAWVPFSIEVGQDWNGLQAQMGTLLADAKDTLEAGKFVSGTGTNEPFGVLTGTTNTIAAATGLTLTLANVYSLLTALPPRYRNNAAFLGDLAILVRIRQLDTAGSATAVWADGLQSDTPARLLGKPVYEASEMAETITNGTKILLFGDFSRYLIVDRVGMTIEVVPHVFGANQRPTGQRGLYCYWRNGAKVLDANAFRAITGTT